MAESGTTSSGNPSTGHPSTANPPTGTTAGGRATSDNLLSGSADIGSTGSGASISATSGTLGSSDPSLAGSGHGGKPLQQDRHDEPSHRPAAKAPFYGYGAKEETYRREIDAEAGALEPEQSWADVQARHQPRSHNVRDRYLHWQNQAFSQVRARPWLAAGVAAGVGLLLGRLYVNRTARAMNRPGRL